LFEQIQSPGVGVWYTGINQGDVLAGGSPLGHLRQLNTFLELKLPDASSGRVVLSTGNEPVQAVAYGQDLFQLHPLDLTSSPDMPVSRSDLLPEDESEGFLVRAFTTGIFYRRSSPDSPPYIAVGDEGENGSVLGLIEVMKSFNQVVFSSTEDLSRGQVVRILVDDSQEVKSGQALIQIIAC